MGLCLYISHLAYNTFLSQTTNIAYFQISTIPKTEGQFFSDLNYPPINEGRFWSDTSHSLFTQPHFG